MSLCVRTKHEGIGVYRSISLRFCKELICKSFRNSYYKYRHVLRIDLGLITYVLRPSQVQGPWTLRQAISCRGCSCIDLVFLSMHETELCDDCCHDLFRQLKSSSSWTLDPVGVAQTSCSPWGCRSSLVRCMIGIAVRIRIRIIGFRKPTTSPLRCLPAGTQRRHEEA